MIAINTIHNIDCLEGLKLVDDNTVDLVVTSPPYNNYRNRRVQAKKQEYWDRTNIQYGTYDDKMDEQEYQEWQIKLINELVRVIKPTGTICYNHKDRIHNFEVITPLSWILKTNAKLRQRITWDRRGMQAFNNVRFYRVEEDIYILGKSPQFKWNNECASFLSIWRMLPDREDNGVLATFPLELPSRCISAFTNENDLVLDPFSGSGTTLVAAKKLRRQFIGFEKNPQYVQSIKQRIEKVNVPTKVFGGMFK